MINEVTGLTLDEALMLALIVEEFYGGSILKSSRWMAQSVSNVDANDDNE